MTPNEGGVDRLFRVALGVALLALAFGHPRTAWGWIGLAPLATGLVGFCPLYRLFGITTCQLAKPAPRSTT